MADMTVKAHKETLEFQAEAQQLLQLMIHSLYSDKEIFLRELVSNASDACDKLRFEGLVDDALYEGDAELGISIHFDKQAKTLTLSDNGVGMDRNEIVDHLGTIAKSGTKQFLESLTGDKAKDSRMIGQFGVGFYSVFIVADQVTVESRRAGLGAEHGVRWISDGKGKYELETMEKASRGTDVILHMNDESAEFMEEFRLKHIIKKYSDHINLPIQMQVEKPVAAEEGQDEPDAEPKTEQVWEVVNQASALWARPKKDISDEEYKEFYKHVAHDFDEPLSWIHNQVEGTQSYTTLLYIPKRAPFDLWDRDKQKGVKLYVKRVFIMDDAEHLMPQYLRFIKGVVDSDDLPLNVSREILQHNRLIDSIRAGSVKKVLGLMETMAKNEPEQYASFWKEFGNVIKEGPAEDYANLERIAKLLRFASTAGDGDSQSVSLEDYVSRMQEGQDKIYYITADNYNAAMHSPHLEIFRKKEIEVLLLSDRVDEWLVSHMTEFDGKKLQSAAKGDLDLDKLDSEEQKKEQQESDKTYTELLEKMQKVLGERVSSVRVSHRLTDSPSCLVVEEDEMALNLQQMLKQAGQPVPGVKPILEINSENALVTRLKDQTDEQQLEDWTNVLFDQALLSEGGQLDDPAAYVRRLNGLLTELTA